MNNCRSTNIHQISRKYPPISRNECTKSISTAALPWAAHNHVDEANRYPALTQKYTACDSRASTKVSSSASGDGSLCPIKKTTAKNMINSVSLRCSYCHTALRKGVKLTRTRYWKNHWVCDFCAGLLKDCCCCDRKAVFGASTVFNCDVNSVDSLCRRCGPIEGCEVRANGSVAPQGEDPTSLGSAYRHPNHIVTCNEDDLAPRAITIGVPLAKNTGQPQQLKTVSCDYLGGSRDPSVKWIDEYEFHCLSDVGDLFYPQRLDHCGPHLCGVCVSLGQVGTSKRATKVFHRILKMYNRLGLIFTSKMFRDFEWGLGEIGDRTQGGPCKISKHNMTAEARIEISLVNFQVFDMNLDRQGDSHGEKRAEYQYGRCDCRGALVTYRNQGASEKADKRWIQCIQIVRNLPGPLFASLLAHELLHAFMWLSYFPPMSTEVEEGLCNMMSSVYLLERAMWAKKALDRHALGDSEKYSLSTEESHRLVYEAIVCRYLLTKMQGSHHPTYGVGFRKAQEVVVGLGWQKTLDFVKSWGVLPSLAANPPKPIATQNSRVVRCGV
eukprot:GHVN01106237.1.p1 GENE.GHVN01106237.1~~GHVN01106237.1.p1  ORF type:complete len:553 (+),score=18.12 GHVN01106237.1:141-1799(+)